MQLFHFVTQIKVFQLTLIYVSTASQFSPKVAIGPDLMPGTNAQIIAIDKIAK